MRIAFILNPAAQGGRARRMWPDLDAAALALGMDYTVSQTLGPGDGERLAVGFREQADVVVAVGGDGTVQEVAAGLAGSETTFGVVPVGTGNDFANAIGMPRTLDAALQALLTSTPKPVDLGKVSWMNEAGERGRHLFTNCLGAGIDALAAIEATKFKLAQGRSAYLAGILRSLWKWRRPHAEVVVSVGERWGADGEAAGTRFAEGPVLLCEIGNGPTLGGGFRITPDAVPNDGLLDVCFVRHVPPRRVLTLLPKAVRGTHAGEPEVSVVRSTAITVQAVRGSLPVQADGETVTDSAVWIGIEVWPGALRVVAPGL